MHTLAHSYAHSCLSTRSPADFLTTTQDRGWRTQRVFNLPQTTASIKAQKATTVLCQIVGWGWWGEVGGPSVEQGYCWWIDEGWALAEGLPEAFVHKGGYLDLLSNNRMQTRDARTIKHDTGVMKKLLGKSSCKASLWEILFTLRTASPPFVLMLMCGLACLCIRHFWL